MMLNHSILLFVIINLSFIRSNAAYTTQNNPYSSFMSWDPNSISCMEFDYIVVGGGAAGCPLATTLSSKASVLILERGTSPYGNPDVEEGDHFGNAQATANEFTSIAQNFTSKEGISNTRARVLGGGTAINAGFYSRGNQDLVLGLMGLDESLVNASYQWVESKLVTKPDPPKLWSQAMFNALLEVGVLPNNGFTLDHVEGTKYGGSIFDNTGRRHSAADLLQYANKDNLRVVLNSTVERVLFERIGIKLRAVGVEFRDRSGTKYQARLKRVGLHNFGEIILSAGALGSPQLLMLSGIGPVDHLISMGITVLLNSPNVGMDIADNPMTTAGLVSSKPLGWAPAQTVGITHGSETYVEGGSIVAPGGQRGSLLQKVAFPKSRGRLRLKSKDPRENPSVTYNYFTEPDDLQVCILGLRLLSRLFNSTTLRQFGFVNSSTGELEVRYTTNMFPSNMSDENAVAKACKESFVTVYHYHGGCEVGKVVDKDHRVFGVDGLRVIDVSTYRHTPGTNPQATTMMLGRYMGLQIIAQRQKKYFTYHLLEQSDFLCKNMTSCAHALHHIN